MWNTLVRRRTVNVWAQTAHDRGPRTRQSLTVAACAVALCSAFAATDAYADRVVVIHATGTADRDARDHAFDELSEAIREVGHEATTEMGALHVEEGEIPVDGNELRAIAEISGAQWAIAPIVRDATATGYWVTLRVGYAREARMEEVDIEVRFAYERQRLVAILNTLLRPEGGGEEAAALAGPDRMAAELAAQEAATAEEERLRREAEEAAAAEAEAERLAAEQAEAEANDAQRFADRERYGTPRILIQAGLGVHPLVRSRGSGTLGTFEIQAGYAITGGLELRGGLDIVFGAAGGFGLHAGAAYFASPFSFPLHIGGAVDIGLFQALTGNKVPSLMVRVGPVVSYHLTSDFYVEAEPSLTIFSANGGVVALGASVRVGRRF